MELNAFEVVGVVCSVCAAIGGLIVRDRYVLKLVADTKIECNNGIKETAKELHERVSKHRDEVKSDYVSKDEYNARQESIERLLIDINKNVGTLVEANSRTNERIDQVILSKGRDS